MPKMKESKDAPAPPPAAADRARWSRGRCNVLVSTPVLLLFSISWLMLGSGIRHGLIRQTMLPELFYPRVKTEPCRPKAELAVWHQMSDEELMRRVSVTPVSGGGKNGCEKAAGVKVAFLFLARGMLPLRPLWEVFFKGHEGLYSIYLHTSPEYEENVPIDSVFHGRRIPSKAVEWGRSSMVDAERRLLANALRESSNTIFILLSETCIPLFNFTIVYNYVTRSNLSFLSSFDDPRKMGRGRYNKHMHPTITLSEWRKGSQWFALRRRLAIETVADMKYYLLFKEHCKPPCYMDEHYLPTMVTKLFPDLNSNRSITWVDWSNGGSHPATIKRKIVSEGLLKRIKSENGCMYNGKSTHACFLFARKFDGSTLEPLLELAPGVLGIGP